MQPNLVIDELLEILNSDKNHGDETFTKRLDGPTLAFINKVNKLAARGDPDVMFREMVSTRLYTKGLEKASEDHASRSWSVRAPNGWTGRDFVRAVQLRTNNLPCKTLPAKERGCRGGCPRQESSSHILQDCSVTHYERIRRHNEIVIKIYRHISKKGWSTRVEPQVYHQDGQLFIPDLAIFLPADTLVICNAQVYWESFRSLDQSWANKRLIYDHLKFRKAAARKWPNKNVLCLPVLLGVRGIWARCNQPTEETFDIPPVFTRA